VHPFDGDAWHGLNSRWIRSVRDRPRVMHEIGAFCRPAGGINSWGCASRRQRRDKAVDGSPKGGRQVGG
jgi:hypothetical protein